MTSQVVLDEIGELNLEVFELNNLTFDFLDNEAESEIGASILTLTDALDIAFQRSKDYQTQKELLYLEALALTFDRYRYTPVFSAAGSSDYQWDNRDQFVQDMQDLTGMQNLATAESTFSLSLIHI